MTANSNITHTPLATMQFLPMIFITLESISKKIAKIFGTYVYTLYICFIK